MMQPLNVASPILSNDSGRSIFLKFLQSLKASVCIIFTLSGIYTSSIKLQFEKAPSIISVIPSGIVIVKSLFTFSIIPNLYPTTLLSTTIIFPIRFVAIYNIKLISVIKMIPHQTLKFNLIFKSSKQFYKFHLQK